MSASRRHLRDGEDYSFSMPTPRARYLPLGPTIPLSQPLQAEA